MCPFETQIKSENSNWFLNIAKVNQEIHLTLRAVIFTMGCIYVSAHITL